MAVAIPWHQRLEARVLAGVTAIVGVSLAALTLVTGEVVARHTISRAEGDLAAAQAAFTHLVSTQTELVGAQTRLITGLPVFRAHMTDSRLVGDVATMGAMAEMYQRELAAAFTIVSDARGRWLASPGLSPDASRERLEALIDATAAGRAQREILALQGSLYIVVTEPATFADEVLGTLTTGYALDNVMAYELARTTGRDVALVAGQAISGSSLGPVPRARLAELLHADGGPFTNTGVVDVMALGSEEYVGATFPLMSNANLPAPGRLILLDSWAPTQAFIDQIRWRLLWTGALVFAFGIGASLLLSRRMSRPLRQIAEVAGEIAKGHWDRRLSPTGSAEAVAMANAFNDMTVSLSHWHEEARQRAEQLQGSYQRFRAVTLSVHDAIVSTDGNGAIIFWHPRAEALFGFSEDEAIGQMFSSLLAPGLPGPVRHGRPGPQPRRGGCAGCGDDRGSGPAPRRLGIPARTVAGVVEVWRPDVPDGGDPRRDGAPPRRRGTAAARPAAARSPEDGRHRPPRQRHRPRLQQLADGHPGPRRDAVDEPAGVRRAPQEGGRDHPGIGWRRRDYAPVADLRPQAGKRRSPGRSA